jgi:hypothetical protein
LKASARGFVAPKTNYPYPRNVQYMAATKKQIPISVIRFGAINDRKVDAREIVSHSLSDTGWRLQTCRRTGPASAERRQADSFVKAEGALEEYDFWAVLVE